MIYYNLLLLTQIENQTKPTLLTLLHEHYRLSQLDYLEEIVRQFSLRIKKINLNPQTEKEQSKPYASLRTIKIQLCVESNPISVENNNF